MGAVVVLDNNQPELYHQNYLMPNSIFIISADYASFKDWPADTAKNIYPSVLIVPTHAPQIIEAYKYCSNNTLPGFSISIQVDTPLYDRFTDEVMSFLFIPGYYAVNNKRVINLIGTDNKLLTKTKETILEFSLKQGVENLVIACPPAYEQATNLETANNISYLFTDTKTLLSYYHSESPGSNLLFLLDPQVNLQKLNAAVHETEEEIKKSNPLLYNTMSALDKQVAENELLKRRILATETELNNYKSHVEILRSSHQAKELQEYYDSEYEILPLWYKRFGHVIKVITGKRSFRSLFNKKIKKSTD